MQKSKGKSLRSLLTMVMSALVLLSTITMTFFFYRALQQQQLIAEGKLFQATASQVADHLLAQQERASAVLNLLASSRLPEAQHPAAQNDWIDPLIASLKGNTALEAIYAGYPDSQFFLVRRMNSGARQILPDAPPPTRWVVQQSRVDANGKTARSFLYLNADLQTVGQSQTNKPFYDPRTRPWYQLAKTHSGMVSTPPYRFSTTHELGITYATASDKAVIGIDLRLQDVTLLLHKNLPTPHAEIALIDSKQQILATSSLTAKPKEQESLASATAPIWQAVSKQGIGDNSRQMTIDIGDRTWQVSVSALPEVSNNRHYLLMAIPQDELFGAGNQIVTESLRIPLFLLILLLPLGWMISRYLSRPIRELVLNSARIRSLDFSHARPANTMVRELNELLDASESMKVTIRDFIGLSRKITGESEQDQLMASLLESTVQALSAQRAGIWIQEGNMLEPLYSFDRGGLQPTLLPLAPDDPLLTELQNNHGEPLQCSARPDTVSPAIAPLLAYPDNRLILLPLALESKPMMGILILSGEASAAGNIDHNRLHYIKALISFAAIAMENRKLADALQQTMNALVKLMASAIDAKSAYAGGHCQRVPWLAQALAEAAAQESSGPLAEFSMSEDDREAIYIASWLHDCGKVTTPEYIVDKATKLETLNDRIHEIRTRFEVLKRDADVRCWQTVAAGGDRNRLLAECEAEKAALDDDFAFVAHCNQGSEFMNDADLARLQEIANHRWLRTLDNRLGLGYLEQQRLAAFPVESLPVEEPLLADKAEHKIVRGEQDTIPHDNPWGFNVTVPELLSNRGELYNMSIRRGTLTEEDRYKINEHIITTIKMLNALPFPKHLQQVSEIAGGHHERMDGKGYPKGLSGKSMSVPARIMAIADVFEALTAADRPYKQAKPMSEALSIMCLMVNSGHLDRELFVLFLQSGTWHDYAAQFMTPAQRDIDNIDQFLYNVR